MTGLPAFLFATKAFLNQSLIYLKLLQHKVIGVPSGDGLHPRHHVVNHLQIDLVVNGVVLLFLLLDVEFVDEGFDGPALEKHGEEDDDDGRGDEHGSEGVGVVQNDDEGKSNGASETDVVFVKRISANA